MEKKDKVWDYPFLCLDENEGFEGKPYSCPFKISLKKKKNHSIANLHGTFIFTKKKKLPFLQFIRIPK